MSSPIYKLAHQNEQKDRSKTEKSNSQISSFEGEDTQCGFCVVRPALLQPCANIGLFTAFYSMAALVTSTLSSYVTSQITTLERQFGFSSKQTGIIMAANDIGYLVCVLFVSYFATRLHIPRSLGVATVIFGVSGITCSLPHFIFGTLPESGQPVDILNVTSAFSSSIKKSTMFGALCTSLNSTQDSCGTYSAQKPGNAAFIAQEEVAKASLVIIVIGMMLQGFGKAPRTSLTITYLDDNTAKVNTGFYMGIIGTIGILGPAVAYLMGGVFSKMYVTLQPTKLTPRHPKWIGAWWLGYVLFGCIALLVSVPLFCFPRRLPRHFNRKEENDEKIVAGATDKKVLGLPHKLSEDTNMSSFDEMAKNKTGKQSKENWLKKLSPKFLIKHSKEFVATLLRLLTNPVYVCMVISGCFLIFTIGGSSAYTPKYLERMFHLPVHTANYLIAGQTLCTSCLGTFIGGYLTKRMKMTAMKALIFVIIVVTISFAAQLMGFVFQCDQPEVHNYPSDENACNSDCKCSDNSYFAVCGDDGATYYSPCHAGCGNVEHGIYQNCTCIPGGRAVAGTCDYSCSHIYAYVAFMGVRSLFGTLSMIPKMIVFIRCVPHKDRPMALGFGTFMMSLLGWLLGPIVFGNIIDGICTIWDVTCGVTGRCLHYDNNLFRLKLHGFGSAGLGLSLLLIGAAYIYARWKKCLDESTDENGKGVEATTEIILLGKSYESGDIDDIDDVGEKRDDRSEVRNGQSINVV